MSMARMAINPSGGTAPAIAVSLSNHTFDSEASVGPETATMTFGNTGILSGSFFTEVVAPARQWLTEVSGVAAALYSINATLVSGSVPSTGTMGAYTNLGADQAWTNVRVARGFRTSVLLIKIRRDADLVEMASVTMTLQTRIWDSSL